MSKKSDPFLQFLDTTTEIARRVVLAQKRKALFCRKSKVEICAICTIIMHPCIITKYRYELICSIIMHVGSKLYFVVCTV